MRTSPHFRLIALLLLPLFAYRVRGSEPTPVENTNKNLVLLEVADDGRLSESLSARTGWSRLHGLSYQVLLVSREEEVPRPVAATTLFRTGSRFCLNVRAYTDLYLYVMNVDQRGEMLVLLPEEGESHLLVRADRETRIPPDDTYFRFVNGPGHETFCIIASPKKLDWVNPRELLQLEGGLTLATADLRMAERQKSFRSKSISGLQSEQRRRPQVTASLAAVVDHLSRNPAARGNVKNLVLLSVDEETAEQEVFHASEAAVEPSPIVIELKLRHEP